MEKYFAFLCFATLLASCLPQSQAVAAPAGPLIKHLSSLLKWTKSAATKSTQSEGNVLQFENGYLVETVVEGNALGVLPHSIRVSQDGELFAVDADNNNIVRITPPLSQYSRARLVAGSFQGKTGHVDGKPNDARFSSPKGVAMDDKGNIYVADTANLAIRKIGDTGVSTIAGGKSNIAGYRDGPSEDAQFSADFDVVYVRPTCSLLVVDRGNAALRQISLNQDDCDYHYSSITIADIIMVVGAIIIGYISCLVQLGLGPSSLSRILLPSKAAFHEPPDGKPTPVVESVKEEPVAGWPSFGQLISDLTKLALESFGNVFLFLVPSRSKREGPTKGLAPLKDSLIMPEDQTQPLPPKKQRATVPLAESRQGYPSQNPGDKHAEIKPPKIRSTSSKDPSLSTKHRSSKRREYSEFYGSSEVPQYSSQARPKSQKEKSKHRHRDKSGETVYEGLGSEPRPVDIRTVQYEQPKFDPYNMRAKYGPVDSYRY